jgi:hypothetical protein
MSFAVVATMLGSGIAYATARRMPPPCSDTKCVSPGQQTCTFQIYYRCVFSPAGGCASMQCPL